MQIRSYEDLNEKSLEIILNFKPQEKFSKDVINEIQKLKGDIKKAITLLPKQEQEILDLRYFQNLTSDKIAQKLSKPKEEVIQILLRGIENIKKNIKTGALKSTKIDNVIKLTEAKTPNQKRVYDVPKNSTSKASVIPGLVGIIVFILILVTTYYFLQKLFSSQMPLFNQLMREANDFVQEQVLTNEVVSKVIPGSRKNLSVSDPRNIKISGSTSLLALSRRWENTFSIEYPKYHLGLVSSDSELGISALIKGNVDIANSSRPLSFLDQKKATEAGKELAENRVALDALIIVVNKKNPTEEISLDDLEDIFNGGVKSWQTINSFTKPVIPVVREKGSGTNDFVINRILEGNDFPGTVTRKNSNQEILKFISENEGAIGYINSTNYPWDNQEVKYVKIKNYTSSNNSVSPFIEQKLNEQAIRYGDYPLAHYLYFITLADAPKKVQDFIGWVLTRKGQEIVRYSGLIPVVSEGD
ncbi:MAG: substrate-binding domain-containing protein [Candidatus Melainabacteria bacterium]|nr:substrate-binding domain-containing protein [Candidatus Melainabacteria bacterium]